MFGLNVWSTILTNEQLVALNHLLHHGLSICGYLPAILNIASLYKILKGKEPSDGMYFEEFCLSLSRSDWKLLIVDAFTEQEKILSGAVLSKFNCDHLINCKNRKDPLIKLKGP